ncbi:MAG TPA: MBL fold metallo-hydrolase [Acidimicrobiia bacterium]|nr:MBL fold metallo-hydrolase [Acidimicrobiia bacterium]
MTWDYEDERVRIRKMNVGEYDNCTYVVACTSTGRAVVIDAAAEAGTILSACNGLDVEAILTTHGHWDHMQVLDEVKDALGVPWYLHLADVDIAGRTPDEPIEHGQEFVIGDVALHTLHTPGHTPGSVSFVLEPVVFSGDTLFPGGPGATRWDYSSFGQIMDSVEQHLFTLPEPTLVYPGHGAATTVGAEKPHAAEWRKRGW